MPRLQVCSPDGSMFLSLTPFPFRSLKSIKIYPQVMIKETKKEITKVVFYLSKYNIV